MIGGPGLLRYHGLAFRCGLAVLAGACRPDRPRPERGPSHYTVARGLGSPRNQQPGHPPSAPPRPETAVCRTSAVLGDASDLAPIAGDGFGSMLIERACADIASPVSPCVCVAGGFPLPATRDVRRRQLRADC